MSRRHFSKPIWLGLLLVLATTRALATTAHAEATELRAGQGQLLCSSLDDLLQMAVALAMFQDIGPYHCVGMASGTRFVVVRILPTQAPSTAHYALVRAYTSSNGGFVFGYTVVTAPTPTTR